MKKILIACLMTFTLTASAQMNVSDTTKPESEQVGEFKQLGVSYATITKAGGSCVFSYRDDKFTEIDSRKSFIFKTEDLDTLYKLYTDFEGIEKDTRKTVDLEDGSQLVFTYKKMMGKMYAELIHIDKYSVAGRVRYMTEKQLKKLFGKE